MPFEKARDLQEEVVKVLGRADLTATLGDAFSAPVLYGVEGHNQGELGREQLLALAEIAQAHAVKIRMRGSRATGGNVVVFEPIGPLTHRRA